MDIDTEREMVAAAISGKEEAFTALVRTYGGPLVRYLTTILKDAVMAEDVAQEVFVRAYRNIRTLRDPDRFRHWLWKIARCAAIDVHRRTEKWLEINSEILTNEDLDGTHVPAFVAEGRTGREAMIAEVRDALSRVSPDIVELLKLRYVYSMSYDDIAREIGATVVQAKARLARARTRIKNVLRHSAEKWRRLRDEMP